MGESNLIEFRAYTLAQYMFTTDTIIAGTLNNTGGSDIASNLLARMFEVMGSLAGQKLKINQLQNLGSLVRVNIKHSMSGIEKNESIIALVESLFPEGSATGVLFDVNADETLRVSVFESFASKFVKITSKNDANIRQIVVDLFNDSPNLGTLMALIYIVNIYADNTGTNTPALDTIRTLAVNRNISKITISNLRRRFSTPEHWAKALRGLGDSTTCGKLGHNIIEIINKVEQSCNADTGTKLFVTPDDDVDEVVKLAKKFYAEHTYGPTADVIKISDDEANRISSAADEVTLPEPQNEVLPEETSTEEDSNSGLFGKLDAIKDKQAGHSKRIEEIKEDEKSGKSRDELADEELNFWLNYFFDGEVTDSMVACLRRLANARGYDLVADSEGAREQAVKNDGVEVTVDNSEIQSTEQVEEEELLKEQVKEIMSKQKSWTDVIPEENITYMQKLANSGSDAMSRRRNYEVQYNLNPESWDKAMWLACKKKAAGEDGTKKVEDDVKVQQTAPTSESIQTQTTVNEMQSTRTLRDLVEKAKDVTPVKEPQPASPSYRNGVEQFQLKSK